MNTQVPIIRQMHDAADDRGRALILLRVPDAMLAKYRPVFEDACRRAGFDLGLEFIEWRRAAWNAVRGDDGLFAKPEFDAVRVAFAEWAASAEGRKPDRASGGQPAPPEPPPAPAGEQRREAGDQP